MAYTMPERMGYALQPRCGTSRATCAPTVRGSLWGAEFQCHQGVRHQQAHARAHCPRQPATFSLRFANKGLRCTFLILVHTGSQLRCLRGVASVAFHVCSASARTAACIK